MNKRGQFYLILAVVISISFFAITIPQNNVKESFLIQDFNDISNNYVQESPKVANYAIYGNKNVDIVLNDYSSNFLEIIRKRNPSLELIYIYNNGTNVTVKSYAFSSTQVETETGGSTVSLLGSSQDTINNINLKVAGQDFVQQVPLQIKNFGDSFSSVNLNTNKVILNLGGTLHNFDLTSQGPGINVLITSKNGNTVQVFQTSGSGKFPVTI